LNEFILIGPSRYVSQNQLAYDPHSS